MKLRFLKAHAGILSFFEGKLLFLPEQTASFFLRHCAFLFALLTPTYLPRALDLIVFKTNINKTDNIKVQVLKRKTHVKPQNT